MSRNVYHTQAVDGVLEIEGVGDADCLLLDEDDLSAVQRVVLVDGCATVDGKYRHGQHDVRVVVLQECETTNDRYR